MLHVAWVERANFNGATIDGEALFLSDEKNK
jgi:hypothetical protein